MRNLLPSLLAAAATLGVPAHAARAATPAARPTPPARVEEYRLKAEFLERFTHFVRWPGEAGGRAGGRSFLLCVLGADPFGEALHRLAGLKVDERTIELRHLAAPADARACQLLFIAASEAPRLDQVLASTRGDGVLTVGDSDGFAARGVIINLFVADDKVGFEVNQRVAKREGFELSAKLLKLARLVGEEPKP